MELPSKILEQNAFNTRPKVEVHMLIVMDESTHEEKLSQTLQTNNKQFKRAIAFLTGYNGIFNVTNKNIKFYFTISIVDYDFSVITIPAGAYELENLNKEIHRFIIEEGYFTEANYPFKISPNYGHLVSIVEYSSNGSQNVSPPDYSISALLGFKPKVIYEGYILSDYDVEYLSFDNNFKHKYC